MTRIAWIGFAIGLMTGCSGNGTFVSADVTRLNDESGRYAPRTIQVSDSRQVAELASFFPGAGQFRSFPIRKAGAIKAAIVKLYRADGSSVSIDTSYRTWDEGPNSTEEVEGDLETWIKNLFAANPPADQPEELRSE